MSRALTAAYLCFWFVVSGGLFAWAILNPAPPSGDEQAFLRSSATIWYGQGSLIQRLRTYEAPQGPLVFIVAGAPAGPDGTGVRGTRALTALTGAAALALTMFLGTTTGVVRPLRGPVLVSAGLLVMPYFFYNSTHFYTDVPTLLALLATMALWIKGRYGWAGLCLSVAVCGRQYALFAWLGLAVVEAISPRGRRSWGRAAMLLGPAVLVLCALLLLWGGPAPRSPRAAAIESNLRWPNLEFVNYYLACAGAYTGWALLLNGNWRGLRQPLIVSAAASPIFWLAIPGPNEFFISRGIPITTLGFVDRLVTGTVGSGTPRAILLWLLWIVGLLCLIRIAQDWKTNLWSPLSTSWFLAFLVVHSVTSQAWDKYFLQLQVPFVLALVTRSHRDAGARLTARPTS